MTKTEAKPAASPDDLLKAAVAGKADAAPEAKPEPATVPAGAIAGGLAALPGLARRDARLLAAAGAALAVGAVLGAGLTALSSPARTPNDAVLALGTTLDAARIETARLGGDIAKLHQVVADLRASTEAARKEATARSGTLSERLAQSDKTVTGKIAALAERLEQAEREQGTRVASLATQIERRAAPQAAPAPKAEPTQTGSLAEARGADTKSADTRVADAKVADAKPKPAAPEKPSVIDGWAVRDVFDGTAILEDRRRRLVEVAPGDMLPGVGRVEGVERHGREWVVVTRQGLVTPQPW